MGVAAHGFVIFRNPPQGFVSLSDGMEYGHVNDPSIDTGNSKTASPIG